VAPRSRQTVPGETADCRNQSSDILPELRKIEADGKYDTVCRVRSTVGQVFRLAVATGRAEYDPTTNLKGALTALR
jgi:hypothetical protein